jgi:hypothetical protein
MTTTIPFGGTCPTTFGFSNIGGFANSNGPYGFNPFAGGAFGFNTGNPFAQGFNPFVNATPWGNVPTNGFGSPTTGYGTPFVNTTGYGTPGYPTGTFNPWLTPSFGGFNGLMGTPTFGWPSPFNTPGYGTTGYSVGAFNPYTTPIFGFTPTFQWVPGVTGSLFNTSLFNSAAGYNPNFGPYGQNWNGASYGPNSGSGNGQGGANYSQNRYPTYAERSAAGTCCTPARDAA